MRRIYIVPNVITAFSLACGLFVIFKANMMEVVVEPGAESYRSLLIASIFLLLAAFADWIDGAIARVMHAESEFGLLFDSLADAVTFGVAPSVLVLKSLSLEASFGFIVMIGAMVFSMCGILRLVRFDVMALENRNKKEPRLHKHFIGLPIPAGAMAVVGTNLLFAYPHFQEWVSLTPFTQTLILTGVMVVLGYFMVSRFKFPSAKVLHFRVPSFHLVFCAVLFAFFVLYGGLNFFPITLATLVWMYILIGWTFAVIRIIAGKKSKTLEDFEPDDED